MESGESTVRFKCLLIHNQINYGHKCGFANIITLQTLPKGLSEIDINQHFSYAY